MLVPKAFIGWLVPAAGTLNFDWWVGACCWYLKLSLVGWYLMLVPKTFIGGLVPAVGTLNFDWWVGACCWYLKL